MSTWNRRSVLAAGVALSVGGVASTGAETDDAALPNPDVDPVPAMADEDWASFAGGAGHARYVEDDPAFDGDALDPVWSVDHTGPVAVADDTVYTTTADGVVALDAADGTVVWENGDVDATNPVVVDETVYLEGGEVVALDRADGTVRWESDLGPEEWTGTYTAAYGGVFVVVDSTLYALAADDGSVRWRRDSATVELGNGDEQTSGFITGVAAANGVVYAGTREGVLAFDPETGDPVWQTGEWFSDLTDQPIYATTEALLVERSGPELALHDAQTGETLDPVPAHTGRSLSDESVIAGNDQGYGSYSVRGEEYDWEIDVTYTYGRAVICGETVYVYFYVDGINYGDRKYDQKLVALDKRDGSERWAISNDEAPVGHVRAISGETIYVDHDGELVALRERTDDDGDDTDGSDGGDADDGDDTNGSDGGDADDGDGSDGSGDGGGADTDGSGGSDADDGDDSDGGGGSGGGDADEDADGSDETDGSEGTDEREDTGGGDAENGTDDGNTEETIGGGGGGDVGEQPNTGRENESATERETTNETGEGTDSEADDVPGFTTGAGLLGGAATLEWLRRKAGVTESADGTDSAE